ncbi:NAD(P)H-dependent oxidoreductase [Streptomyces sp. SID13031]|uniref:NADPH-dependent FMN reductase n=1 Tax=Streptomyces sp. SID13031 TaxID=2706046 RepID=UPI0031BA7A10
MAEWFAREVESRDEFKLDLIDLDRTPLADLPARIDEADAFVIVCPEYNHGYPGDLKTAIDAVRRPWYAKPVSFIVYGGRSGGLRAAEQLRQVFGELHAVTIRETLSFHQPTDPFNPRRHPDRPHHPTRRRHPPHPTGLVVPPPPRSPHHHHPLPRLTPPLWTRPTRPTPTQSPMSPTPATLCTA